MTAVALPLAWREIHHPSSAMIRLLRFAHLSPKLRTIVPISLILLALLAAATAAAVAWTVAAERRAADLRQVADGGRAALGRDAASTGDRAAVGAGRAARARSTPSGGTPRRNSRCSSSARDAHEGQLRRDLRRHRSRRTTRRFLALAKEKLGEFQQGAVTDLDVRQKAIADLVQPLRESLTKVDAKLQRGRSRSRHVACASLAEQLRSLTHAQLALQSETGKLSRALRSPNVRGQWGELQLRRVLEAAGMLEGNHFEIKESAHGEDGRLTPDVVVKLPGGKNVVVDAKVALTAFLDGDRDATTRTSATRSCKDHARQVQGSRRRAWATRATGRISSRRRTSSSCSCRAKRS